MNYWQDPSVSESLRQVDDVVDVVFRIECPELPVDNAYALYAALYRVAPWIDRARNGVHPIYGAASGNGWQRPEHVAATMRLSKRTRLRLRVVDEYVSAALELSGTHLDVAGFDLVLGEVSVKKLQPATTLFSRFLSSTHTDDEERFLRDAAIALESLGIPPLRLLAGMSSNLDTPDATIRVQSLLVDALTPPQSLSLQREGLGPARHLGCGMFVPHRGIAAIDSPREDISGAG